MLTVREILRRQFTGLSHTPKLRIPEQSGVVEEHSVSHRRRVARPAGGIGRDYAGTSSDKTGEKPVHQKPKVS
jgi:hypothetical protein